MGFRGPKPQPRELRVIKGNPSKRKLPNEPQPRPGNRKPPAKLGLYGAKLWKRLAPELIEYGLFKVTDRESLMVLCHVYDDYMTARAEWMRQKKEPGGLFVSQCTNGILVTSHLYKIVRELRAEYERHAKNFGLSPAFRVGLDVKEPGDQSNDLLD